MILALIIASTIVVFACLVVGAACVYVWYMNEEEMKGR